VIRVVGHWDIWQTPEIEHGIHWRFLMRFFGVERLCMIPETPWQKQPSADDVPLVECGTLEHALSSLEGYTPVVVDENGTTDLDAFVHPADALYVFGCTGKSALVGWTGASIHIQSAVGEAAPLLQPAQACALVLYDRLRKSWQ